MPSLLIFIRRYSHQTNIQYLRLVFIDQATRFYSFTASNQPGTDVVYPIDLPIYLVTRIPEAMSLFSCSVQATCKRRTELCHLAIASSLSYSQCLNSSAPIAKNHHEDIDTKR